MRRLVLLATFAGLAVHAQTKSPVEQWIAANAIPLTTPEAGHGFADMQPIKKLVGNARIVSLGEATHGSREFFQLKHRMLEFLATEMGFTIFSIEANMPEAYRLNDYVLNGTGDPAALLKGMYFWTWNTEEVLDMIKWMRDFNKSGKGRVEFTGFDMQTPDVATEIVRGFVAKADPDYASALGTTIGLSRRARTQISAFAAARGTFPVADARGKKLRFSGWIKTEDVGGYAGLWWRVDGRSGPLAFDNMSRQAIKGTTEWKRYEFELPVAAEAVNIDFGALLGGAGTAWFDDLTVELDGKPYQSPEFDFGFESSSLKGLGGGGGQGYRVGIDSTAFHSGKQSLQIRRIAPMPAADSVEPKEAGALWKDVVQHLEASREAYASKASNSEIEWAIQNARVTLQCMQLRANQVPRDRSMAENVKWILDQNPKAKIVLWAHNGHVNTPESRGYEPMGTVLRNWYGGQMVVFGFAFHQGSFQAVPQGGMGPKNFTVPPAVEATLDTALANAGVPLFALDLRGIPKSGAVADWFAQGQKTRSIGALYPEDNPTAYITPLVAPQSFDAMLFVEKTTAARKNP